MKRDDKIAHAFLIQFINVTMAVIALEVMAKNKLDSGWVSLRLSVSKCTIVLLSSELKTLPLISGAMVNAV